MKTGLELELLKKVEKMALNAETIEAFREMLKVVIIGTEGLNELMKIDFEQFLMEEHADRYVGPKDMMLDDFNRWLEDLSIDEWFEYGNLYAKKVGKENEYDQTKNTKLE